MTATCKPAAGNTNAPPWTQASYNEHIAFLGGLVGFKPLDTGFKGERWSHHQREFECIPRKTGETNRCYTQLNPLHPLERTNRGKRYSSYGESILRTIPYQNSSRENRVWGGGNINPHPQTLKKAAN